MTTLILIAALTQSIELQIDGSRESRMIVRALDCDLRVVDEDTAAFKFYQQELRRLIKRRQGVDCFLQIGATKSRIVEPIAFDNSYWLCACLKREIDLFNQSQRTFVVEDDAGNRRAQAYAGILTLGDEGKAVEFPQPWEETYSVTAFVPPQFDR